MLKYMERHPNFAKGRLEKVANASLKVEEMRNVLAKRFNAEPGASRSASKWWKVCVSSLLQLHESCVSMHDSTCGCVLVLDRHAQLGERLCC